MLKCLNQQSACSRPQQGGKWEYPQLHAHRALTKDRRNAWGLGKVQGEN